MFFSVLPARWCWVYLFSLCCCQYVKVSTPCSVSSFHPRTASGVLQVLPLWMSTRLWAVSHLLFSRFLNTAGCTTEELKLWSTLSSESGPHGSSQKVPYPKCKKVKCVTKQCFNEMLSRCRDAPAYRASSQHVCLAETRKCHIISILLVFRWQ